MTGRCRQESTGDKVQEVATEGSRQGRMGFRNSGGHGLSEGRRAKEYVSKNGTVVGAEEMRAS
jgi:hypothetical protein